LEFDERKEAMTPEERQAAKEACERVPKDPWWVELFRDKDKKQNTLLIKYRWDDVPTWLAEVSQHPQAMEIAEFIAIARTALPAALAAIEQAEAENGRMRKIIDALPKTADGVIVVPGLDRVYHPGWRFSDGLDVVALSEIHADYYQEDWGKEYPDENWIAAGYYSEHDVNFHDRIFVRVSDCYSTETAALAQSAASTKESK